MRRLRLTAALAGLGALVACPHAWACLAPERGSEAAPVAARSAAALALLERAATVAQAQSWQATERVVSLASGVPVVSVMTVQHGQGQASAADVSDLGLFSLLVDHYDLRLAGPATCSGRKAELVEARRPQDGTLAGRFWVDADDGLLLRREVLDERGSLLRSSELVGVRVGAADAGTQVAAATAPHGDRLDEVALSRFEGDGWPVLRTLTDRLDLYDARWLLDHVLQLSYSDGLSTLSLFLQKGEMPPLRAAVARQVAGEQVWQAPGEPERLVWAADGFTWTLVADVDPALVDDVLTVLPHTQQHVDHDRLVPRLWRGLSRVGAWLNPFH